MDVDVVKAVALISGILAILDKLIGYGKSASLLKKIVKIQFIGIRNGSVFNFSDSYI
jgi:hypothetical protein